jgi:sec-independent protein translocase protein TatA
MPFGGFDSPLTYLLIILIILILFGAKKIPEMMHGLGKGISEFKRGTREATDDLQRAINAEPAPQQPQQPAVVAQAPKPAEPESDEDKPAA